MFEYKDKEIIKSKNGKQYYKIIVYSTEFKKTFDIFVNEEVFDYCSNLEVNQNITSIVTYAYNKKIGAFNLSIVI